MHAHRAVHQAASLLLQYPDEEWPGLRARVAEALGRLTGAETEPLLRFCRDTAGTPLLDLADR
ncbi:hypothetical protein ACFZCP_21105 [Streptomyces sp. NPDC007971]|uniref:hypothetical protein n=1 Tax=Streptomyces sp. NPDC007971 TaxID=3364799 RepID=UPI0036E86161